MPAYALVWLTLLAGGVAIGASFVCILVVRRWLEPGAAMLGMAGVTAAVYAFNHIANVYQRMDALLYALGFAIASAAGGYALAASLLDKLAHADKPVSLPESTPAGRRSAIIVLACVEPQEYDPSATAEMLVKLQSEDLLDASFTVIPFIFTATKARYRAVGGRSDTRAELRRAGESLERMFEGREAVFDAACSDLDALPQRIAELTSKGFSDFTVVEISIGEPLAMAAAKRAVDAMRPDEHGVTIRYAAPLWDSPRLATLVMRRTMELVARPAETGIVLLGHGQPEAHSRLDPRFDEHETMFLNRIRQMLADKGVPESNIRVAWTEWREPDVTGSVRHLAALGCRRVLVVPACYPFETLDTRLDIPTAIKQSRVDTSVVTVTAPTWNNDPVVIEELRVAALAARHATQG